MKLLDFIIRPLITEKAALISSSSPGKQVLVFVVNKKASKEDIKKAIEFAFKTQVEKIRTLNYGGNFHDANKSGMKAGKGKFKKAMITLKQGQEVHLGNI
jgi:large subunit ribosomal protein L23